MSSVLSHSNSTVWSKGPLTGLQSLHIAFSQRTKTNHNAMPSKQSVHYKRRMPASSVIMTANNSYTRNRNVPLQWLQPTPRLSNIVGTATQSTAMYTPLCALRYPSRAHLSVVPTDHSKDSNTTTTHDNSSTATGVPLLVKRRKRPIFVDVKMTDAAKEKLVDLSKKNSDGRLRIRLRIISGGCSGFQYQFKKEDMVSTDDAVISALSSGGDEVSLLVDSMSAQFMRNCVVDFVEDFLSASFQVVNNAAAKENCSCGHSFAAED
eukprot:Lankesteria_metandrocarpae@DN10490_c0_g1_i1.p1